MRVFNDENTGEFEELYFHENARGDVVALTNDVGDIALALEYSSYGVPYVVDDAGELEEFGDFESVVYGFQGRRIDEETSLMYFRNRFYNQELGRFLQRDPLGYIDSFGLYEAFGGSSYNHLDPFGLYKIIWNGAWTAVEKKTIKDYFAKTKTRIDTFLLPSIEREKIYLARVGATDPCAKELYNQLTFLENILQKMSKELNSKTEKLTLGKSMLGQGVFARRVRVSNAFGMEFYDSIEVNVSPKSKIPGPRNMNFFLNTNENTKLDSIFHEISHAAAETIDLDPNSYKDPHQFGKLAFMDLRHSLDFRNPDAGTWEIYNQDYRAARVISAAKNPSTNWEITVRASSGGGRRAK
ncbi:RHS repeat domain-containing protein [Candidatus Uabimicrobium sp. HlEnr_7]|uniref:RHS repeat domain-containing protein n=1 Tax=Candidatus Uabimicrobium helgolandensis TaxID=3095367 RepID=UPI00355634AC